MMRSLIAAGTVLVVASSVAIAQQDDRQRRPPTHADVSYGPHERHRLDLWLAESDEPTPLVIYIHGGGFRGGSKSGISQRTIRELMDAGISVASFEYRLLADAKLPAAHEDCRRALQFVRSKAGEWNIDPERIGAYGGSAGAQLCMWLAFHDDMARLDDDDEVARQSTRLKCVATTGGQTTMEFAWWKAHIPGYTKPHRPSEEYFGDVDAARLAEVISDISALSLISADDPPIWMSYRMQPDDPLPADASRVQGWKVHHVKFGVGLQEAADNLGVEAHLNHPGHKSRYPSLEQFLIDQLK